MAGPEVRLNKAGLGRHAMQGWRVGIPAIFRWRACAGREQFWQMNFRRGRKSGDREGDRSCGTAAAMRSTATATCERTSQPRSARFQHVSVAGQPGRDEAMGWGWGGRALGGAGGEGRGGAGVGGVGGGGRRRAGCQLCLRATLSVGWPLTCGLLLPGAHWHWGSGPAGGPGLGLGRAGRGGQESSLLSTGGGAGSAAWSHLMAPPPCKPSSAPPSTSPAGVKLRRAAADSSSYLVAPSSDHSAWQASGRYQVRRGRRMDQAAGRGEAWHRRTPPGTGAMARPLPRPFAGLQDAVAALRMRKERGGRGRHASRRPACALPPPPSPAASCAPPPGSLTALFPWTQLQVGRKVGRSPRAVLPARSPPAACSRPDRSRCRFKTSRGAIVSMLPALPLDFWLARGCCSGGA